MLCKVCRHCGLCPGDGKFLSDASLRISSDSIPLPDLSLLLKKNNNTYSLNDLAIVFDIGTTTIEAYLICLKNLKKISFYEKLNQQTLFGSDVISRLSHASSSKGYNELRLVTLNQLEKAIALMLGEAQFYLSSLRAGRPNVNKIIITGNTVMQSLLAGVAIDCLATFPFKPETLFGYSLPLARLFGKSLFISDDCPVFFAPVISAFVGGDTVTSMLACGFLDEAKKEKNTLYFLADVGTNCEMAVWSPETSKILCTSAAAGPAFEGQGIDCGMKATSGAIVKVEMESSSFLPTVIAGISAKGLCGSGLLSAMALFYKKGIINSNGSFAFDSKDRVFITKDVFISQKDIRSFQLAKAAVFSGLTVLEKELAPLCEVESQKKILYFAGAFGTKLNEHDAAFCGLIPKNFEKNVIHAGNAALVGAFLMAIDDSYVLKAKKIAALAQSINLADLSGFQEIFINSLNFPN